MVDVRFCSLTGESLLKTNGFKASRRVATNGFKAFSLSAAVSPGSRFLKPMVLRHLAEPPGETPKWQCFKTNGFKASVRLARLRIRLPKNQWLISRRFVSLADGSKKLSKMVNKLHLSAKEQIRLPNNHWFFGRRNCKVHF